MEADVSAVKYETRLPAGLRNLVLSRRQNLTLGCAQNARPIYVATGNHVPRWRLAYISSGPPVLTSKQKQTISEALRRRDALNRCARCGNLEFSILDTVFTNNPGSAMPGASKQSFPTIGVACTLCGALTYHLLGVLAPLREFGLG